MRGIMQARTKALDVIDSSAKDDLIGSVDFKNPEEKKACTMIDSENVSALVNLLRNEAKVI